MKLKKLQGHGLSADAKADLKFTQLHGQEHMDQFKRRLSENGVTGFSETITLHVTKCPVGDKTKTSGKYKGWDDESTSLCGQNSVFVFIGKVHGCRDSGMGLSHYRTRVHKVLVVTDETKVVIHVENHGIRKNRGEPKDLNRTGPPPHFTTFFFGN